jgi:hypothetical protein
VLSLGAERDRPAFRGRARALGPERARQAVSDRDLDLDHRRRAARERRRPALARFPGRTWRPLLGEVNGEVPCGEPGAGLSLPLSIATGRTDQIDPAALPGLDQQRCVQGARIGNVDLLEQNPGSDAAWMVEVVASSETAAVVVSTWVIRFGGIAPHVSRSGEPYSQSTPSCPCPPAGGLRALIAWARSGLRALWDSRTILVAEAEPNCWIGCV